MKLRLRKGLVFKVATAMVAIGALSFVGIVNPSNSSVVFADASGSLFKDLQSAYGDVLQKYRFVIAAIDEELRYRIGVDTNRMGYKEIFSCGINRGMGSGALKYGHIFNKIAQMIGSVGKFLEKMCDAIRKEQHLSDEAYDFFFKPCCLGTSLDGEDTCSRMEDLLNIFNNFPRQGWRGSDRFFVSSPGKLSYVDLLNYILINKGILRAPRKNYVVASNSVKKSNSEAASKPVEEVKKPVKEETKAVSKPVKEETKAPAKKGLNKPAEENEDMSTDVSTDMSDDDILATLNKVSGDNDEEMVDIGPTRSEINANGFGSRVEEVYDGEEKLEDYVNYQQIEQVQAAVLRKAIKYCKTVLEMIAKGMSAYAGNNKTLSDPNSTYGIEMTTKSKDVLDKLEQITEKLDMRESGNVSQLPGIVKGLATDMTASVFLMQKRVKMLDAKIKEMEKMDDPDGKIREKIRRVKYDRKLLNMLKVYYGDLMLNLFINSNVREQFKVRGDKKDTGKALSILKEACDISELENLKEVNAAEADFNDKFGAFKKQVNGVHKTFVKKVQKLIDEKQEILSRDRIAKRQAGVEEARKRIKSNSAKFKRRTKRSASVRSPENRISLSGSAGAPAKKLAIKKPALVGVSRGKVAVTQPDGSKKVVKTLM